MTQKAIIAALETALLAAASMATSLPNVTFTPPATGVPYRRVNIMFAEPENLELGSIKRFERGFMQIDLCFPKNRGDGPAREAARVLVDYFYRGRTLVNSGVTVIIKFTPEVSSGADEGDRWVVPCKIPFHSYI